jgi:amidase
MENVRRGGIAVVIEIPGIDQLKAIAEGYGLELKPHEFDSMLEQWGAFKESWQALADGPDVLPPVAYPKREPGHRPSRAEDPLNAVLWRCAIKGASSGKLAGKRIGLKDNVCVAGQPLTCASSVLEGYVPDFDATIVTRILEAGGEIVAKLNMDAWSGGGTGDTGSYGRIMNPFRHECSPGGSSGGSGAALYYDWVDMTIGGDQGGSIRIPAAWCGVIGLKPTHGLVPYTGIVGMDATFDHTGPMARSAADAALLLEVIAGKDSLDPRQNGVTSQGARAYTKVLGAPNLNGLRIGVLREGFGGEAAEADVEDAVRRALVELAKIGAEITDVSVPEHRGCTSLLMTMAPEAMGTIIEGNGNGYHFKGLYNSGLAASLAEFRRTRANDFPPMVKSTLVMGAYLRRNHPQLYPKAQNRRRAITASYDRVFKQVDVIAMPTVPFKAIRTDQPNSNPLKTFAIASNTAAFDITGHPSLSMPCGKSEGLPIGLMLTGRSFEDATLLGIADVFERNVSWEQL